MSRLLIVDDELAIIEALEDILSLEGYEVTTAFNGAEGLKKLREAPPNLVLLDLMMPVMDGRELLRHIRADPKLRALPVVIMSAGRIGEEERSAASATLSKPFELDALLEAISRHAGKAPPDGA